VKNIPKGLSSVWLAGVVLAWLLCAKVAAADQIVEIDWLNGPVSTDGNNAGTVDLAASEMNGWFFSPDPEPPFPTEPDPSQPWTSAANIATMDYWLSLVMELGDDPSLLTQLYGLGMITSPDPATPPVFTVSSVSQVSPVSELNSQEGPGNVPEPVTRGLLGAGLVFLGLYAGLYPAQRARRTRGQSGLVIPAAIMVCSYGPL